MMEDLTIDEQNQVIESYDGVLWNIGSLNDQGIVFY